MPQVFCLDGLMYSVHFILSCAKYCKNSSSLEPLFLKTVYFHIASWLIFLLRHWPSFLSVKIVWPKKKKNQLIGKVVYFSLGYSPSLGESQCKNFKQPVTLYAQSVAERMSGHTCVCFTQFLHSYTFQGACLENSAAHNGQVSSN